MYNKIIGFLKKECICKELFTTKEIAQGIGSTFFLTQQHLIDLRDIGAIEKHVKGSNVRKEYWRLC
ncbi:hypothetical protein NFH70_004745 [Salmonella enterica]|nr:hypothetical protein [Salmonella enterica]EJI5637442.1 hypothetical protein [Salmonella enterica]EJP9626298.1 hypothetical protein [Salmonella enterica]